MQTLNLLHCLFLSIYNPDEGTQSGDSLARPAPGPLVATFTSPRGSQNTFLYLIWGFLPKVIIKATDL